MKGKSLFTIFVLLVLLSAAIMFLIQMIDFDDMDGDDWTQILIVLGILLGIGALIINTNSKTEEKPGIKLPDDVVNQNSQKNSDSSITPSDNLSERETEELLRDMDFVKHLYDSEVITYPEFSKIEKAIKMEKAGVITHEQFLREIPDTVDIKIDKIKQQKLADEEKSRKRHETLIKLEQLRDAGTLTPEEFKTEKRKLYS